MVPFPVYEGGDNFYFIQFALLESESQNGCEPNIAAVVKSAVSILMLIFLLNGKLCLDLKKIISAIGITSR